MQAFWHHGFPCGSAGKESTCKVGEQGSIPGLRIFPGEGKCYPLQYPGLENSMDCIVHGVAQSRTRLSDLQFHSGMKCMRLWCPTPANAIIVGYLEDLVEEEELQIIQKGRKRGCSGRKWGNNIS